MVQGENHLSLFVGWRCSFSSSSDISATIFLTRVLHPKVELCCDSVGFWDTRNLSNRIWVPFFGGLRGRVQFYKLLQRCCLSLPVYWLNLSVAPRGNISPACGLGRDKKIITIIHHFKIFALRPPPSSSSPVWASQTQARVAGRTELNWRPHHGGLWSSSEDHPRNNCFSFAKMNKMEKKDCKKSLCTQTSSSL